MHKIPLSIVKDEVMVTEFTHSYLTDEYVSWLNDPDVVKYSEQRHYSHSISSCTKYFYSQQNISNYFLAIVDKSRSNLHIGNMSVALDGFNHLADMSIMLGDKDSWGKGIGYKAWTAVMEFLFRNVGIRKVTAGTMSVNTPMINLMKRANMTIEGIRPGHFIFNESEVDLVLAGKFRE